MTCLTKTLGIALFAALFISACGSKTTEPTESATADTTNTSQADDAKIDKTAEAASSEVKTEGPKPASPSTTQLAASHILVMHNESKRKPPTITRTKDEALTRITEALAKIKGGADFGEIAKEYSDCPSKEDGGKLGVFFPRMMAPTFSEATEALAEGALSEPVETPFGYHVIKRENLEEAKKIVAEKRAKADADKIRARHILVMHTESSRKPASITRTKKEAKKIIEELKAKLDKGADFEKLAKQSSDCPSKNRGGDLGSFGKGMMAPPFEKAAYELKDNEISSVVETDFGYHLIQRIPKK